MVVAEHMNWKLALPFCVSPLTLVATTLAAVKPSKVVIQFVVVKKKKKKKKLSRVPCCTLR
jgi:lipopolysaccharide export LptBFGC system permease protein LptF